MSSDNGTPGGMLRRMVSLVTPGRTGGPAADSPASQFADAEKAELKAMIERKRRNDFIRKRELDMLRRIRREGLGAQDDLPLAASSHLDDSDIRPTRIPTGPDRGVKAKIDAIEKQMVGLSTISAPRLSRLSAQGPGVGVSQLPGDARAQAHAHAPTQPMSNSRMQTLPMDMGLTQEMPLGAAPPGAVSPGLQARAAQSTATPAAGQRPATPQAPAQPAARPPQPPAQAVRAPTLGPGQAVPPAASAQPRPAAAQAQPPAAPPARPEPSAPQPAGRLVIANTDFASVEVNEIAQDHEMDEAVIAFANADFAHCERILTQLVDRKGVRHKHVDTWLALFDFYRATGQQARFESMTNEFVPLFQRSGPQWFSIPALVADATASAPARPTGAHVGWICPPLLSSDAVAQLASQTLQLPQPWVMDWGNLQRVEPDAAERLRQLFHGWSGQPVQMRWTEPEQLLRVLTDSTPTGLRDVDPAFWMARLETLRIVNRADQFDEVAIDYCITYEVSPPSWEPSRSTLLTGGPGGLATQSAELSVLGDIVTTNDDSPAQDDNAVATLDLSGQLAGDLSSLLDTMDHRLHASSVIHISCALLIRVDFIAAGDLLNWVIAKRAESRHVRFIEVHRLVALMFGAMGINDHAPVQLRQA